MKHKQYFVKEVAFNIDNIIQYKFASINVKQKKQEQYFYGRDLVKYRGTIYESKSEAIRYCISNNIRILRNNQRAIQ